jgi:hypothetical protein
MDAKLICQAVGVAPRVVYRQPPRWQRLWAVAGVKVQSMEKKTEGAVRKRRRLPEVILWLKVILFSNI